MNRRTFAIGLLLSLNPALSSLATPPSSTKQASPITNGNVILNLSTSGFNDNWYITDTGVNFSATTSGAFIADAVSQTWNRIELKKLELMFNDVADNVVNLYPLSTTTYSDSGIKSFLTRGVRYDSSTFTSSAEGTTQKHTLIATYELRKIKPVAVPIPPFGTIPLPIGEEDEYPPEEQQISLDVSPKVVNTLLVNSTTLDGGGPPSGWWPVNQPAGYSWPESAAEMVSAARSNIAGHFSLTTSETANPQSADFHSRDTLISDPQKVLSKATVWFNTSHGLEAGVQDKDGLLIGWSNIASCFGSSNASFDRKLQLNMAFLYCCDCAKYSGLSSALFGSTAENQAAVAFNVPIYTNLRAGDRTQTIPYNNSNGTVLLLDKLSSHTSTLMGSLSSGTTISQAIAIANELFPPRTYSHSSSPGVDTINYMKLADARLFGDPNARICTVYRPDSSNSSTIMINDYILIKLLDPQQVPIQP
ncbi:MAG: hypothetical protein GYA36_15870 [Veillonellaceae bacterium]|nr:hypothetical protein [Veillonellaceae bacterium]